MHNDPNNHFVISQDTNHVISFRLISLPKFPLFDLNSTILLTSLQSLNLSQNPAIGDKGAATILRIIEEYSPRISVINLSQTGLGDQAINAIRDILMVNRIKSLKLGNNRLHAMHFSQLALGLSKNSILTVLYLENNKMNTVSCKLLAPFIKYSKSLSIFDISGNSIGDEGVIEIVRSLARNKSLIRLNLSNTSIGSSITKVLVQSMRTNTTLKGLDLSNNKIEDQGCKYIAKIFQINNSIMHIDMQNNIIGKLLRIIRDQYNCQDNKELNNQHQPRAMWNLLASYQRKIQLVEQDQLNDQK